MSASAPHVELSTFVHRYVRAAGHIEHSPNATTDFRIKIDVAGITVYPRARVLVLDALMHTCRVRISHCKLYNAKL
eukprot:10505362-Alexandrium_andersonii.AAC.1